MNTLDLQRNLYVLHVFSVLLLIIKIRSKGLISRLTDLVFHDYITSSQNFVLITEVAKAANRADALLEYVRCGDGVWVTPYTDSPFWLFKR